MDSLALLCNLHGDGPSTLAGLRALGCYELFEVLALDPTDLGELFAGNRRTAERFGREALLLADRLGEDVKELTQEDRLPTEAPLQASGLQAEEVLEDDDFVILQQEHEVSPGSDIEEFAPGLEATSTKVLTPFPALSKVGPESAALLGIEPLPAPVMPKETQQLDSGAPNGLVVQAVLDVWTRLDGREPAPSTSATSPLMEAELEGLTQALADTLAAAGVHNLGQLLAEDVLNLSSATRIPYTKLAHLQFLGRKQIGSEQDGETVVLENKSSPGNRGELTPFGRPPEAEAAPVRDQESPKLESFREDNFAEPYAEDGPAGPFA